jgi:hypothetical protein
LGISATAAAHEVRLFRRRGSNAKVDSAIPEIELDRDTDLGAYDFIVLAFEMHAETADDLRNDETLATLLEIPLDTPIASVVLSPSTQLLDAFLKGRKILHFVTTPAAELPGAVALLRESLASEAARAPLLAAFPDLKWRIVDDAAYARLGFLIIGSGLAAAALAHLASMLGGPVSAAEREHIQDVLGDAQRLMTLTGGDGFEAFGRVATPGGFTEKVHNKLFRETWPRGGG